MKQVYFCPQCERVKIMEAGQKPVLDSCMCGGKLQDKGQWNWEGFSEENRQAIKANWKAAAQNGFNPKSEPNTPYRAAPQDYAYQSRPAEPPYYAYQGGQAQRKSLFWIRFIRTFTWILFAALELYVILLSIGMFERARYEYTYIISGLLTLIIGTILALLLVAFTMIILDAASDLRAIRNKLDR